MLTDEKLAELRAAAEKAHFVASVNPTTVLALLDDLDTAHARVAELETKTSNGEALLAWARNQSKFAEHERDQAYADIAELEQVVARVREVAAATAARAAELRSRPGNEHDNGRATAYKDAARELEAVLPEE